VDLVLLSYLSWEYNTYTAKKMIHDFPWGVVAILGSGLIFVLYVIYYILRMATEEMKDHDRH
jgi:hypothetical protein